jgi:two-component sensor histidine kinase
VFNGPEVRMGANASTTLGMILHELTTNASKYGALSAAGGRVEVSWESFADEPASQQLVRLTWIERGGPPVDACRPAGFGTSFITRSVEYELAGKSVLELAPEGLRCVMTFPICCNVAGTPGRH